MAGLDPAALKLHQTLLRHARGMLTAWEEWVRSQVPVVENPDPIQHFKEVDEVNRAKK